MEKNIVALTENELENISGGKKSNHDSEFGKGFSRTIGKFCASLLLVSPFIVLSIIAAAASSR